MRSIVIDSAVSGDDLREQFFAGNLVILTRLEALTDFVDYTRDELAKLFKPYDPDTCMSTSTRRNGQDPGRLEASLHPLGTVEEARAGCYRRGRLPARGYALRPAQAADVLPGGPSHDGCRLCFPVASRRLVQRASLADQLVASNFPGAGG